MNFPSASRVQAGFRGEEFFLVDGVFSTRRGSDISYMSALARGAAADGMTAATAVSGGAAGERGACKVRGDRRCVTPRHRAGLLGFPDRGRGGCPRADGC